MVGKQIDADLADEWCFFCKDGGSLRVCDFKNCRKAYHHNCVERDESFLEDDEDWECPWHLCYKCKKKAVFQCYGCPNRSVCHSCIKDDEFARVRNRNKGFCKACLRLSMLIEENADYDSDGERVDFDDPNSEEYLFRDYWYTIKDSESISLSDLKSARRRLKQAGGENENMSEGDYEPDLEPEPDSSTSFLPEEESRKRKSKAKFEVDSLSNKKNRSKMRNFSKWGSEELIDFLVSIGRDGDVPMSHGDVERVVKEYIEKKNLYQPGKKKKFVLCDESLKTLFGKGKSRVKFSRICKLLEGHFPGSQGDLILLSDSNEEQEEESVAVKKRKVNVGGPSHVRDIREGVSEGKKRCKATLVRENIKLIYLRRALVLRLLKENPDTFEQKIMGCFVRVKHNLKDFYDIPPNLYQIGQVTGVKKDTEMYQVGEMSTDIVICMSNIHKDIKLFSLADDDFSDEDVEDLQKLVQKGYYTMPTVGEVAEKLKYVHEDITGHWIEKELLRLTNLKKQANEKGWRREMFDYINRIDILRKPEEQERLKKEMPPILADSEEEKEEEKEETADSEEEKEEEKEETTIPSLSDSPPQIKGILADSEEEEEEENEETTLHSLSDSLAQNKGDANGKNTDDVARKPETSGERTVSGFGNVEENKETRREINMAETNGNGLREDPAEVKSLDSLRSDCSSNTNNAKETNCCFERPTEQLVEANQNVEPNNAMQEVIDLSDSDSEMPPEDEDLEMPAENEKVWYYLDPQEMVQGPFSMKLLRSWRQRGFFDEDFKVWRKGQLRGDAILLSEASRNSF
ncbi:hypothetical protein LUZ63_003579 [Rhynchospora breviuscula]|uniref:Uncharacterized protein n=1 Tax=Rhynchospora breviuscula TaxID=2022672 RepID=A0A9Q0HZJ0_9POAL|nr:hypothetical protein LUZ63_003579 [Rhynchospora breviuscula]